MKTHHNKTTRKTKGFSLIEVLVSLVILTISGLSILSLNSFSTREVNHLKFQQTAERLSQEILTRAQLNATNENKGIYAIEGNDLQGEASCLNNECGTASIAKADIHQWTYQVIDQLPNAGYQLKWDNDKLYVAIKWQGIDTEENKFCPIEGLKETDSCRTYVGQVLTL